MPLPLSASKHEKIHFIAINTNSITQQYIKIKKLLRHKKAALNKAA